MYVCVYECVCICAHASNMNKHHTTWQIPRKINTVDLPRFIRLSFDDLSNEV